MRDAGFEKQLAFSPETEFFVKGACLHLRIECRAFVSGIYSVGKGANHQKPPDSLVAVFRPDGDAFHYWDEPSGSWIPAA